MNLSWLTICAEGQTDGLHPDDPGRLPRGPRRRPSSCWRSSRPARATSRRRPSRSSRSRSRSTSAIGALIVALRLPIYLDSIGTVLVGALAGPWAGALTGLLANLIWSILPVPGGAGPTIAFFAPVAGVIGLMAGFWAARGVFRLRADDSRVGEFLALAAGVAAAAIALLVVQNTIGLPELFARGRDPGARQPGPVRRHRHRSSLAIGVVVAWSVGSDHLPLLGPTTRGSGPTSRARPRSRAFALVFAILRLLFGPTGYFSTVTGLKADGTPDDFLGGANLTGLAVADPARADRRPASSRSSSPSASGPGRAGASNARLFPVWVGGLTTGLVAAAISAPIAAGVFGGVTGGGHRRARRPVPDARPERLPVGLRPGPDERPARQDDLLHGRLPHPRRAAADRADDVQPRRGDGRRVTPAHGLTRRRDVGRDRLLPAPERAGSIGATRSRSCWGSASSCSRRSCCRRSSCRSSLGRARPGRRVDRARPADRRRPPDPGRPARLDRRRQRAVLPGRDRPARQPRPARDHPGGPRRSGSSRPGGSWSRSWPR